MIYQFIEVVSERPTIVNPNKDMRYHSDWARYIVSSIAQSNHSEWLAKIERNRNFYTGKQWLDQEDVDTFLKDDNNDDRNRLQIVDNIIRPMVEQYRGNAIRMNINFSVKAVSPQAINRRDAKLQEMLTYSEVANRPGNPFAEQWKKKMPVGDDQAETRAIFNNSYSDDFARSMTHLSRWIAEKNKFDEKQLPLAEQLALSGLGVMKTFEYNGRQVFDIVQSDYFAWDRSAKKYDLSDAAFQMEIVEMTTSEIFEQFPDAVEDKTTKENIENYGRFLSQNKHNVVTGKVSSGKIPVLFCYWKDGTKYKYGYVKDKFGYDYLTKIDYVYDGEEKARYTEKDVIMPSSLTGKKLMGNKKTRMRYSDELRMCAFIPREIVTYGTQVESEAAKKITDVVLDWGLAPYQETETLEYNSVVYPYKCYAWAYINGEVMSPIDDAIDPQRLINRVLSVAENQINNSGGSGVAYDVDMLEDEGQTIKDLQKGKPVGFRAKGRGMQNAITTYDTNMKAGTQVLLSLTEILKNSTQRMTGVNEALRGESTGNDQLVGVTQLMIQRGSLMQEPFYNAMLMVFKQCFQAIASVGKRIYADNNNSRNLAIAVGDDMAEIIRISKEMVSETFRAFVKRENSDEILKNAADQMLMQLINMPPPIGPLIDEKRFADLFGRATPDDVAGAIRAFAKEKQELKRLSAKNEQQQQAMLEEQAKGEQQQQQAMFEEQTAREDIKELMKQKNEKEQTMIKGLSSLAKDSPAAKKIFLQKATQQ